MAVEIRELKPNKRNIKKFTLFSTDMYKDNPYYVPDLLMDNYTTLNPAKNPASEFCDSVLYMAYRDGKAVGRIAGIINRVVNERCNEKNVRFGFVDFIDDEEVSAALMGAVEAWGKSQGMTHIVGPLGFSDMDPEGMLVEGFDQEGTMATLYNHPYYPEPLEKLGFEKDTDWVEFRITVPDEIPEKMVRICEIVKKKYNVHNVHFSNIKDLVKKYGQALFDIINEAYSQLYGYSPLTPRQINHYISMYLPILKLNNVSLIADGDDNLVGVGIAMPSLSKGLIKSRGKLFPFGWIHLLKALMGKNNVVDLLLVAIKPEYQSKGINSLLFNDLIPNFRQNGYCYAESNPELDDNQRVQLQWQYFETVQHKRRRAFKKAL